jgi:hypothetical protein
MYLMIITTHWAWPRTIFCLVRPVSRLRLEYLTKDLVSGQYLVDIYWKCWLIEYFPKIEVNLKPGELITVNDKSLPRGMWPIGGIEICFPVQDGVVRVVEVRTNQGLMEQPAVKIHSFWSCWQGCEVNTGEECGHSRRHFFILATLLPSIQIQYSRRKNMCSVPILIILMLHRPCSLQFAVERTFNSKRTTKCGHQLSG